MYFIFSDNGEFPKRRLRKMKKSRLAPIRKNKREPQKAQKHKRKYFFAASVGQDTFSETAADGEDRKIRRLPSFIFQPFRSG